MKRILCIGVTALLGAVASAESLNKEHVAGDAKWLAHLDMQELQKSTIGEYLLGIFKDEVDEKSDSLISIDIDALLQELHSLTAYGMAPEESPEQNSVLIVRTGAKARTIIDAYVASEELKNDGKTGIKVLEDKDYLTYLVRNEVYVSFPQEGVIVSSKSFDQIERAMEVIEGDSENLVGSGSEIILSEQPGFFFLATVDGIDSIKGVPLQARIFQKAKGGQISLGEFDGKLRSNIILLTSGAEVSNQLSRIIDGIVAVMSFTKIGGERLDSVMNSVLVKDHENRVSINLDYSVGEITKLIEAISDDGPGSPETNAEKK